MPWKQLCATNINITVNEIGVHINKLLIALLKVIAPNMHLSLISCLVFENLVCLSISDKCTHLRFIVNGIIIIHFHENLSENPCVRFALLTLKMLLKGRFESYVRDNISSHEDKVVFDDI